MVGLQLVTGVDPVLTNLQSAPQKCLMRTRRWFADAWSVLNQHLRAKYGAAEKETVDMNFAESASCKRAHSVYAESLDVKRKRHDSIGAHWDSAPCFP